jgi:hypothetical protein
MVTMPIGYLVGLGFLEFTRFFNRDFSRKLQQSRMDFSMAFTACILNRCFPYMLPSFSNRLHKIMAAISIASFICHPVHTPFYYSRMLYH